MLLQTNQTGVEGWHGFRVPERYNCITSQHVRVKNMAVVVGVGGHVGNWRVRVVGDSQLKCLGTLFTSNNKPLDAANLRLP